MEKIIMCFGNLKVMRNFWEVISMYEHKFVKIKLSTFKLTPEEDYHQVVHEHEKEGWELVG